MLISFPEAKEGIRQDYVSMGVVEDTVTVAYEVVVVG